MDWLVAPRYRLQQRPGASHLIQVLDIHWLAHSRQLNLAVQAGLTSLLALHLCLFGLWLFCIITDGRAVPLTDLALDITNIFVLTTVAKVAFFLLTLVLHVLDFLASSLVLVTWEGPFQSEKTHPPPQQHELAPH